MKPPLTFKFSCVQFPCNSIYVVIYGPHFIGTLSLKIRLLTAIHHVKNILTSFASKSILVSLFPSVQVTLGGMVWYGITAWTQSSCLLAGGIENTRRGWRNTPLVYPSRFFLVFSFCLANLSFYTMVLFHSMLCFVCAACNHSS